MFSRKQNDQLVHALWERLLRLPTQSSLQGEEYIGPHPWNRPVYGRDKSAYRRQYAGQPGNGCVACYHSQHRAEGNNAPIGISCLSQFEAQICGTNCVVSIFKGESAVPVKFQIKDANGNVVQVVNPPQWITPQKGNTISDSVNESEFTDITDSGSVFSLDGEKYQYNWKTKDIPSGYHWLIGARLDDGQTYMVNIGLR